MKFVKAIAGTLILTIIVLPLILLLPQINIDFVGIINSNIYTYLRAGLYFLPVLTVSKILILTVSIWVFRVIVSLIRTIWELLPLV